MTNFLSIVLVVRNQSGLIEQTLRYFTRLISTLVSDYELIIIDNASDDASVAILKDLTREGGLPNLQVYTLTAEVDTDTAAWVGLENALGDYVAVVNPLLDSIDFLTEMLQKAAEGADVVFATNNQKPAQGLFYRAAYFIFNKLYKWFNGIQLNEEAPSYRLLNKKIINFILQHRQPALAYRHLPATGGFNKVNLRYSSTPNISPRKRLRESIDRGMRLLVSTTRVPMRLVTSLSLFGAIANLLYSGYIVIIALFKSNITPGWISLSLQQSGMFFLISLVLLVLGEYILHMATIANEGPLYHVAQEFTSARMLRREKLNVEEAAINSDTASKIPSTHVELTYAGDE